MVKNDMGKKVVGVVQLFSKNNFFLLYIDYNDWK